MNKPGYFILCCCTNTITTGRALILGETANLNAFQKHDTHSRIRLLRAKKADRFLVPAINIVETAGVLLTIWDFIVYPYRFSWFNIAGLISFAIGFSIYVKARVTLGKFFSEKLRLLETHQLVTSGIYKHIRHPIYTGEMLLLLGFTAMLNSLAGFLVMFVFVPLILVRIPFEEAMLKEACGQPYNDYAKQTKKLIPHIY